MFVANNIPYIEVSTYSIRAVLNVPVSINLTVIDPDGDTVTLLQNFVPATINGASLQTSQSSNTTYIFTWTPQSLDQVTIR